MKTDFSNTLRFLPLELEQIQQVEDIRKSSGNTLYVYSFPSLFAWQADEEYSICIIDDAFIVKNGAEGDNAYLFPCGTDRGKRELIDALLESEAPVFYAMRDEDKSFLEKEYPQRFSFDECRDEFPYLYDREAQLALSGKDYKSLRHRINLGKAAADVWQEETLTDENAHRAIALNERWLSERSYINTADTRAAETALNNFSALSMWGMLFKADGEDIAYVAGAFVTPEIFDVSFCKVLDNRCDCYIKWALYRALPKEVKIVDSEEDLGLEGLRKHKLLRRPKELTRIWKGTYI